MKNKRKHKEKVRKLKKLLKGIRGVRRRNKEEVAFPKPMVTTDKKKENNKKKCRKYKQNKEEN